MKRKVSLIICCLIIAISGSGVHADEATDWFKKGNAYIQVHNYAEALECFNQSVQGNPNDARAWNNMGYILGQMNRTGEALEAVNRSIELNPEFAYAWNTKGFLLVNLGQIQEAMDTFNKTLEIDPDTKDPNNKIAKSEIIRLQKKLKKN